MDKVICLYKKKTDCFVFEESETRYGLVFFWFPIDDFPKDGQLYICPSFFLAELKSRFPDFRVACMGDVSELTLAFEGGALDFFKEPYSVVEICLRARRLIGSPEFSFSWGTLVCDKNHAEFEGIPLDLGVREITLLFVLARNAGIILTKKRIAQCSDFTCNPNSRVIDVYVSRIRAALGIASIRLGRSVIQSIYGKGYLLLL